MVACGWSQSCLQNNDSVRKCFYRKEIDSTWARKTKEATHITEIYRNRFLFSSKIKQLDRCKSWYSVCERSHSCWRIKSYNLNLKLWMLLLKCKRIVMKEVKLIFEISWQSLIVASNWMMQKIKELWQYLCGWSNPCWKKAIIQFWRTKIGPLC